MITKRVKFPNRHHPKLTPLTEQRSIAEGYWILVPCVCWDYIAGKQYAVYNHSQVETELLVVLYYTREQKLTSH